MQIFDEIRVNNNTYITDNGQEIALEDVHKHSGYWLCGFDRDGSCFEMCKVSRDLAEDIIHEGDEDDLTVCDFGNTKYYWNANTHDSGVLHIQ